MKNSYLLLLAFSLSTQWAMAQSSTISGQVTDAKNNTLPGANIYLEGTYTGTSTDAEGRFKLICPDTGHFVLLVDFVGYNPYSTPLSLTGQSEQLSIALKEQFNQLKAVSISAGEFAAGEKAKSVVLNSLDIVTTAGALGDVVGAMQTLPGTSTVGESGRLFVRGGDSRESSIYMDGLLVQSPFTTEATNNPSRGRFNPFMFSGTVFNTGGYSAEYGQALSSVLLLETKELPIEDEINFSIMALGGGMAATKKGEKSALTLSLDYINLGPYLDLAPKNLEWEKAPETINGAASYRLKTGKTGMLKVYTHFNRAEIIQFQPDFGESLTGTRIEVLNEQFFANTSWKGTVGNWVLQSGISLTNNQDRYGLNADVFKQDLQGGHFKANASTYPHEKVKVKFGAEGFARAYAERFDADTAGTLLNETFTENRGALFAEVDLYASNKFVTRLGGRMEHSVLTNTSTFVPRLSTALQINENSQVSFAFGQFHQDPSDNFRLYAPQLAQEKADHYILSYQVEKEQRFLRVEVYHKNYNDLVYFLTSDRYIPEGYNNSGYGKAQGFDLFFRDKKTVKNGQYWLSYSFLEAERLQRDYPSAAKPSFASTHNFSFVYKHWIADWKSMVGGAFTYGSPRPFNNPNQQEFNGDQLPSYRALNINWAYLYRQNIIFYSSVSNVLGTKNIYGYNFADTPNAAGVFESEAVVPPLPRMFFFGCFITLTKKGEANQLDQLN